MITFPTHMQTRVYKALEPVDHDVLIEDLFMSAYPGTAIERMVGDDVLPLLTNRDMQQYLGPLFARMNTRLEEHNLKIIPGQLKQTYRLAYIKG